MDRAYVICHMMTTIDGKISIEFEGNEAYEQVGAVYDQMIFEQGQAYGCGRATFQTDRSVDMTAYKNRAVTYEDKIQLPGKGEFLCVAFDRKGKLRWDSNILEYAGHRSLILEVLTEAVPPEVLAYYDDMHIPYMFAGKEDFDPALFLQKLKEQYGVTTFMLCGGAEINAVFMDKDLVDEISLVIGAAVDGTRDALTMTGSLQKQHFPKYFHIKEANILNGDGVLLRYVK